MLAETTRKENELSTYLQQVQCIYNSIGIKFSYTIETEYDCCLPKHKSTLNNIQSSWKNCGYTLFLDKIRNFELKGTLLL